MKTTDIKEKRIKNDSTVIKQFESKIMPAIDGCWYWVSECFRNGYGRFTLPIHIDGPRKRVLAHRLSYILYKGKIGINKVVLHSCDNKVCVNPDHLSSGTTRDNIHDMIRKGRRRIYYKIPIGSETHCLIMDMHNNGLSDGDIAALVDISYNTISRLIKRSQ